MTYGHDAHHSATDAAYTAATVRLPGANYDTTMLDGGMTDAEIAAALQRIAENNERFIEADAPSDADNAAMWLAFVMLLILVTAAAIGYGCIVGADIRL